ncbi:MAG TPA: hypothetical protein VFD71_11810 [Planctomycetota bacterium]|nr:hypothetical protein [Planctomycetota bacterium]
MERRIYWMAASCLLGLSALVGCGSEPESTDSVSERKRLAEQREQGADRVVAGEESATEPAPMEMDEITANATDAGAAAAPDEGAKAEPKEPKSSKKAAKKSRAAAEETARPAESETAGSREDQVLNELRRERTLQRQEADYHGKKGDELFSQNLYEEAVVAYGRALDLDPSRDDIRTKWNRAKLLLGERSGELEAVSNEIFEQRQVQRQQSLEEIRRHIAEGKEALSKNDPEQAEKTLSLAVDMIAAQPDVDAAIRTEATELLKEARHGREALVKAREDALREETERQKLRELDDAAKVRQAQVQELLRKASEFIRQHDYEKAVEACEGVLKIEPENRVAKFWLSDSKEQILQERRMSLIRDRLENDKLTKEKFAESTVAQDEPFKFPSDAEWRRAQERSKTLLSVQVDDPEPIKRIKNALATQVSFDFDKTPLSDVLQQIRTVTGAKIAVDSAVNAAETPVSGTYRSLPAFNVLNLVLESVGMTYVFKENVLFVTNPGQKAGNVEFGIYNVSDILNKIRDFSGPELILRPSGDQGEAPISFTADVPEEESRLDPDKLIQLIKESTGGEEAWGEPNSVEFHNGQLLVTAPREMHGQLQNVLENLRKDSDLFVVIEARFIDVNDDFLEDIGVDYRALGLANNYGTPFGNVINDGRTGGQDLGFVKQGSPVRDVTLIMGQDRWAGRVRHIIDGFTGTIRGERLTGGQGIGGLTLQTTFLEPFQINVILRAVQEKLNVRQLTAPVVTAHNGQRVFVSVITQRAYIADYNLVSGGTGFAIIEVADPEVQTFQEGVILDVDPVISHDKKYVTLDVRPTLATLIGGVISTILISLGSFTNVANQVPIGIPEISLQQSFTSVTVPNGGTVLLGGFKSLNDTKLMSYLPILGKIPILGNLFRRKAQVVENRSLVILLSVKIVDLRGAEAKQFNAD